jgi:DNA processing protein
MSEKYLLGLHQALGLTHKRFLALRSFFGLDFERAFFSTPEQWTQARIDSRGITKFFANRDQVDLELMPKKLKNCEAKILTIEDPEYPLSLKNIYQPPVLLFLRGEIFETDFPSVSVVGARKISDLGKRAAEAIIGPLAQAGLTIVSGFAYGADTLAHKIALEHGSRTIAVLGNGIDDIYPSTNQALAEKILRDSRGAILSEYLPGTPARPENFPVRNRIVAGLSKSTVLIEAASKSGTLITAQLANDMGRDVWAIPGNIFAKNSAGNNQLIATGEATALIESRQILESYGLNLSQKKMAQTELPTTGIEGEILEYFQDGEASHIDEICRSIPLENQTITAQLLILEMKGWIKSVGQQSYIKNW